MDKITLLWEIEQIKQLKARYFRLVDAKQWVELRTLFTDDMVFQFAGFPQGSRASENADGFIGHISQSLSQATTVHHGHMPEIEITSPTAARGIWAMFDWVDDALHGRAFQGYGHYYEDYEKDPTGRWRIKRVKLVRLREDRLTPTDPKEIRKG